MLNINYATANRVYDHYAGLDDTRFYAELGWDDRIGAPGHQRGGAMHLSLALTACGVQLNGPVAIGAGAYAGRRIDAAANRLAEQLQQRHAPAELIACAAGPLAAAKELRGRRGIVAFMQRSGPEGGAMALLDGKNADAICMRAMHARPYEIRFWPLN
jgi:hypothetical protein